MGILRTDVISHSQISNGNASVLFDGTADRLTIPSHSAFAFGTADWTVEGWFYFTSITGQQTLVGDTYGNTAGFYLYKQSNHRLGVYYSSLLVDGTATIEADRWYHFAFVRNSGRTRIYINGELDADGADTTDATITQYYIADTATTSGEFFGNISNLRITRTAVYKTNFTVPKFKLKEIPGTILLCCQSSSSTTEATVSVPGTLTTGGDPTATAFGPGLKEDITDTGVVFDGVTTFDSQAYMVPPGGNTRERNRGRMILFGGGSPGRTDNIDSLEIQSMGNAVDFGSLSAAVFGGGATASSTRGVFWMGEATYTTLEFVTISNSSNTTTFGTGTSNNGGYGFGNQTRGIWALGTNNALEFVTIATTGNTTDFGDQTLVSGGAINEPVAFASPTRGVIAGGYGNNPYPQSNVIEFVTIATTGNATDFGDLTQGRSSSNGLSNSTRGIIAGGYTFPGTTTYYNIIEFVTIATTGNATDFGDAVELKRASYNGSSPTRGVFAAGTPATSATNSIEFITIATTGNATDFGDTRNPQRSGSGCSDSHGGLS